MLVTARLSKSLYDRLGADAAQELLDWFNTVQLAYRDGLLRLNEANFARFDAKLDQRFAERDARFERRLAELEVKWEREFSELRTEIRQEIADLRQEIADIRGEMADFKGGIGGEMADFKGAVSSEMAAFKAAVCAEIAALRQEQQDLRAHVDRGLEKVRVDLLRWMIGTAAALGGLVVSAFGVMVSLLKGSL